MKPDDYVEMSAECFIVALNNMCGTHWRSGIDGELFTHLFEGDDCVVTSVRESRKLVIGNARPFYRGALVGLNRFTKDLALAARKLHAAGNDVAPARETWLEWTVPEPTGRQFRSRYPRRACLVREFDDGITFQTFESGGKGTFVSESLGNTAAGLSDEWFFSGWVLRLDQSGIEDASDGVNRIDGYQKFRCCTEVSSYFHGTDSTTGPNLPDWEGADMALAVMMGLRSRDVHLAVKGTGDFTYEVVSFDPLHVSRNEVKREEGGSDYVEMSAGCFLASLRGREFYDCWRDPLVRGYFFGAQGVVERVSGAGKFFCGQNRNLGDVDGLAQTAKTFFANGINILPFPDVWLEWDSFGNVGSSDPYHREDELFTRNACLASHHPDGIAFQYFGSGIGASRATLSSFWWFSGWIMLLKDDGTVGWESIETEPSPYPDPAKKAPWIGPCVADFKVMNEALAFLAMLTARETRVVEKRPPAGIIAHRKKKGLQPLFSYKVVTIAPERIVYQSDGGQASGITRSSPRLHWRRGHVRTLNTGKKVGIPPCIVGAAENGIIDKTYRVRPTEQTTENRLP